MGRTLRRTAALTALWRAFTSGIKGGPTLGDRLGAVPRMIWATVRGRYDGLNRLLLMLLGTLYVVSPIDIVPEAFFLMFGVVDDALVVTWVAGALLAETERFLQWEGATGPNVGPTTTGHATGPVINGEVA